METRRFSGEHAYLRGNFRSTWFSSGGYEPVAKTLFGHCRVDGFFLEYDSDRAGDFTPLRYIKNQKVVLGLITSKSGDLEDKGEVIARIKEASQYVLLNNYVSALNVDSLLQKKVIS